MTSELTLPLTISSQTTTPDSDPVSRKNWLRTTENAVVSVALLAMVLIPLAESFLRRIFQLGIPASTALVQHMVLVVGMLGGAIAAREGRLLSLSTLGETSFHGRWKTASRIFTSGVSAAVTGFLCLASYEFVASERAGGQILAYRVPMWVVESVLPLGFAMIAIRILLRSSEKWGPRVAATLCALMLAGIVMAWPGGFHHSVVIAMFILLVASVLGLPAFISLGGVALVLFWGADQPIAAIPVAHYSLVTNPSLPTLPLFTLAGYFLAEGGAPKRLVRAFYALFGQFRGGPAIVTVLVCALFTSFTGASGVTILALGGLLMPVLPARRYSEKRLARIARPAQAPWVAAAPVPAFDRLCDCGECADWADVSGRNYSGCSHDDGNGHLGHTARVGQRRRSSEIRMARGADRVVGRQVGVGHTCGRLHCTLQRNRYTG